MDTSNPCPFFISRLPDFISICQKLSDTGTFRIDNVVPQANGESSKVKVKVRVSIHGLFSVSSASLTEKVETAAVEESEPMDVDVADKDKKPSNKGKGEAKENNKNEESPQEPTADLAAGDGEVNEADQQQNAQVRKVGGCHLVQPRVYHYAG